MTIRELKELTKDLPDDMKVGNTGHFGEFLEVFEAGVTTARFPNPTRHYLSNDVTEEIFAISIENAGEEPN